MLSMMLCSEAILLLILIPKFRSVKQLNAKIRTFIDNWNDDRAHPFVWTKTADEILTKANRPTTSNSGH
jgi:hypothetical protein